MGDLEVATDELRRLGSRLDGLSRQLRADDTRRSYDRDVLAHPTVVDGMNTFADNWDDNREHVAERLTKLGELAEQTADGFETADDELAREVAEAVDVDQPRR